LREEKIQLSKKKEDLEL
jgi:intraflagellar transport protein 74